MTCSNLNSPAAAKNERAVALCAHCGLPVYGTNLPDPVYCCCGCEMAATILKESRSSDVSLLPTHALRVALAFIASMFVTIFSATIYQEQENAPLALSIASFALTLLVFGLLAKEFLQAIGQELRKRSFSIATLVFVGSGAAFAVSSWNLTRGDVRHLYFETAAMALTLYVISLAIDAHFKLKLSRALSAWTKRQAISVVKLSPDSRKWRIDASALEVGDEFELDLDFPLPVDAVLTQGFGEFDESHLTGEPLLVFRQAGEAVKAGATFKSGTARFRATSRYDSSSLNRYFARVLELKAKQSSFERLAEKGASALLFVALFAAATTFVYHARAVSLDEGLLNALSVLLISCPCGLAIATPIAIWLTIHRLEQAGVTVSGGGAAIEKLASVKCLLLDKTGTLTDGVAIASVEAVAPLSREEKTRLLSLAVALESAQEHPIAQAFRDYAARNEIPPASLETTRVLQGKGVEGTAFINGERVWLALLNARDERALTLKPHQLGLFLNGKLALLFSLSHQAKADAQRAMEAAERLGLKVAVLTGDGAPKPDFIKRDYHNALSPEQKAELVKRYERDVGAAVYVGDGLNDLEAMTTATTSIALFRGANQAKSLADFTLFNSSLLMIAEMIAFARSAKRKALTNIVWAIGYNSVGILLAAFGFLTPLWAIAIMTASSTMVTLNSLSLLKANPALHRLSRPPALVDALPDWVAQRI